MKANELSCKDLMVGDWVYLPSIMSDDKYPVQVLEIQDDCIKYYVGGKKMMVRFKYVEPIPLTPNILEKNGFEEYNGLYRLDVAEGVFVNADFKSEEPFVSIHNTCYRATPICKYLHQLQHALRLCGITREIIL